MAAHVAMKNENTSCYFPKRFIVTALCFMGMFNIFAMRVSFSVAIVAMVNSTQAVYSNNSNFEVECPNLISKSPDFQVKTHVGPKLNWDIKTQALILGAFYYGNIVLQIPAGLLSEKIGTKWVFGGCILNTAIFTLLTPIIASWNATALIIVRIITGLGEGGILPTVNLIISQWSPITERSRISSIIFTGSCIGSIFSMAIAGWLCSIDLFGGWPSVFYLLGITGCIWFLFWIFLMHETPSEHPTISLKELCLFQESNKELPKTRSPVPWIAIFSSLPMWAVVFAQVGSEMAFLLFITYLPTYLSTILHFNIREVGLLSALPFIVLTIASWIASYCADALRISNILRITNIRKVFNSIGLFGPAVCLMIITSVGCRPNIIVFLMILANGFLAFGLSGYNVTHVDMSPTFAATLYAITNTVGSCTGFIGPAIVGFFTSKGETMGNWNIIFYITAGICTVTGVIFAIFASAELQDWQTKKEQKKSELSDFTVK